MARTPKRAKDPNLGGGSIGDAPKFKTSQRFDDLGSYGLRAFSGYVREEILPQLLGREAQRAYREMLDNSSVVGSIIFAITQAMRSVTWRVEPPNDSGKATEYSDFVESMMGDMSQTWDDFMGDSLSMLGYGFSVHEIVYKRRNGRKPDNSKFGTSKFNDGKISWRRLPGRGQDTVLKWFFDENGAVHGLTQQPYSGPQIDLPIQKLLLFRTSSIKNNPEGRSILRNSYRAYYFIKRLEELEAIGVERLNGFPLISIPSELIERATSVTAAGLPADPSAASAYAQYKKIATNIRMDEQMGMVLPSDVWKSEEGKPSSARMFGLEFLTPSGSGTSKSDVDKIISRYKIDILMTVLADFIQMGHEVRGTNNLAVTKVDMFYQAIEGWLTNHAAILNRYALPRLWKLNGFPDDQMPTFKPDMAQRLDLDSLGAYVANLATAGMPMFPDEDLQKFLREAGGMPEDTAPEAMKAAAQVLAASIAPKGPTSATSAKPKKTTKQVDMFEAE